MQRVSLRIVLLLLLLFAMRGLERDNKLLMIIYKMNKIILFNLAVPISHIELYKRSFRYYGTVLQNSLPSNSVKQGNVIK